MKKFLALFLSAALLLALLCACGGTADPKTTVIPPSGSAGESASIPPADTTQEPSPAPPSEEPTEEVSEAPSAEPSQEPSQAPATQAPATQAPATQAPATQTPATQTPAPTTHHPEESHHVEPTHHPEETHHPEPSPTIPGGGIIIGPGGGGSADPSAAPSQSAGGDVYEPSGPTASDVDLTDFSNTVLGGSYGFPGMMELPTDFTADLFPGLTAIPVVQRIVSVPMMSGTAAALVLVQVENSDHVGAVKAILQDHVNIQISRNANYPAVVEAYQNNTQIVSHGRYVMLVVHSQCDDIVADFNALF